MPVSRYNFVIKVVSHKIDITCHHQKLLLARNAPQTVWRLALEELITLRIQTPTLARVLDENDSSTITLLTTWAEIEWVQLQTQVRQHVWIYLYSMMSC